MLTLYTWDTPNGRKPLILLEELALPYDVRPVDLHAGAQHDPAFRALNPMERIPVLVDEDVGPVFESNAILWRLASTTGRLLADGRDHVRVMQWLFFQAATCGPAMENAFILRHRVTAPPAGELTRHVALVDRSLQALEGVLGAARYLAADFSIADIALVPHVVRELKEPEHADRWPAVRTWLERCLARPSVEKGLNMTIG